MPKPINLSKNLNPRLDCMLKAKGFIDVIKVPDQFDFELMKRGITLGRPDLIRFAL